MKKACLAEVAQKLGRALTKDEEATLDSHFNTATRQFIAEDRAGFQSMSPAQRMVEITKRAKDMAVQAAADRSDTLVHKAMVETNNLKQLERVADKKQAVTFVRNMINQDAGNQTGNTSVETLAKATHMNAMRRLQDLGHMDEGKFFGLMSNPERRTLALKAASGESTGDPVADKVGKAVADVNKEMIAQAKSAGVSIHENPLWHRPQVDDVTKIRATPVDKWVSEVAPLVDREVMLDGTGRENTPQALEKYLREIYETKAMDGVNKRAAGTQSYKTQRVGSLNKERQLYFKDTDSYIKYMDSYAEHQTAYQMFDAHYRAMAKDIALAQKFGPDAPAHIQDLLNKAHDMALRETGTDVKASGKVDREAAIAKREVDNLMSPNAAGDSRFAMAVGLMRDVESAVMLGNGILSAVPDAGTLKLMAELTDIPQARLYKSFFKASTTKEQDLTAHGIFISAGLKQINRFGSENLNGGTKVGRWLNNAVHHASLLHLWDKMGRAAWSEGVMWKVGELTRTMTNVDDFNKNVIMGKQGVDQHIFDIWRAADLSESPINKSDRMLTPDSIYSIPDAKLQPVLESKLGRAPTAKEMQAARSEAAVKLLSVVYDTEQSAFRGAMSLTNKQQVSLGYDKLDPNSAMGQLWRCFTQFKSVPFGIFKTHFIEVPNALGGGKGPLGMSSANWHRAKLIAYTTLLGGLATQLKGMARGEQPKSVVDPSFWLEAFATGGGLGFYADTLKASFDAKGAQDVLAQMAGPVPNAGARLLQESVHASKDIAEGVGKKSDVYAQHALKWLRQNAAVGTNIFWAKAAFNRMVYDQAQDYFVPGTTRKQAQQAKTQRGTDYWWTPGHATPDHSIDFSKMLEKPRK